MDVNNISRNSNSSGSDSNPYNNINNNTFERELLISSQKSRANLIEARFILVFTVFIATILPIGIIYIMLTRNNIQTQTNNTYMILDMVILFLIIYFYFLIVRLFILYRLKIAPFRIYTNGLSGLSPNFNTIGYTIIKQYFETGTYITLWADIQKIELYHSSKPEKNMMIEVVTESSQSRTEITIIEERSELIEIIRKYVPDNLEIIS